MMVSWDGRKIGSVEGGMPKEQKAGGSLYSTYTTESGRV